MFLNFFGNMYRRTLSNADCSADPYWDNVVLMMHFDDANGDFIDETGKVVSVFGNTSISDTQKMFTGKAGYFDGSGDYLTIPASTDFNFGTGDFTIEYWQYLTSLSAIGAQYTNIPLLTLSGQGQTGNFSSPLCLRYENTCGDFRASVGGNVFVVTTTNILKVNIWQHIAILRENGILSLYVDGAYIGGGAFNYDITNSTTSLLGMANFGDGGGTPHYYPGYIDELRITKGVARYSANSTKLLCHFDSDFTEETGKTITLSGNTKIVQASGITQAAYFDGSGDYLTTPLTADFQLAAEDFTVEGWIYPTQFSGYHAIIGIGRGCAHGAETTLVLQFNSAGALAPLLTSAACTWNICVTYYGTWTVGEWQHFALVRNGSNFNLYRNGVSIGNFTSSLALVTAEPPSVFIGSADWNGSLINYYCGYMYELRLSKGIARYTSDFTPSTTPLSVDAYTKLLLPFTTNLEDSTNLEDYTSKVMTVFGNTSVVNMFTPKFGTGSVYFDGSGDYLTVPADQDFVFTGDFTVEGWVYSTNNVGYRVIMDIGHYTNGILLRSSTGGADGLYVNGTNIVNISGIFPLNTWANFVLQRSGTLVEFIVDGEIKASAAIGGTINSGNGTVILGTGHHAAEYFQGYLDEFRISKSKSRYIASGDVLLMHMITEIADVSGKNITIAGNVAISSTQSKFGEHSAYFDGTGDYLRLTDAEFAYGTGDFTIDFWFYKTGYTGVSHATLISQCNTIGGWAGGFGINISRYGVTDKLRMVDATGNFKFTGTTTILDNNWYHLALVRASGVIKCYLNGVLEATVADTTNYTGTICSIGSDAANSELFMGYMDEVRISKGVAHFTDNFTPSASEYTYTQYLYKDTSSVSLPPTEAFTYEGSVVSGSNPIPPIARFPSCRE